MTAFLWVWILGSFYLVLTGEPSVAEVQALIGFPQGAQLPLQSSPIQLGGTQLCLQHGALSQQLGLRGHPVLLLGLQPATPTHTVTALPSSASLFAKCSRIEATTRIITKCCKSLQNKANNLPINLIASWKKSTLMSHKVFRKYSKLSVSFEGE